MQIYVFLLTNQVFLQFFFVLNLFCNVPNEKLAGKEKPRAVSSVRGLFAVRCEIG